MRYQPRGALSVGLNTSWTAGLNHTAPSIAITPKRIPTSGPRAVMTMGDARGKLHVGRACTETLQPAPQVGYEPCASTLARHRRGRCALLRWRRLVATPLALSPLHEHEATAWRPERYRRYVAASLLAQPPALPRAATLSFRTHWLPSGCDRRPRRR